MLSVVKATVVPKVAPANMSEGKCTPNMTRDEPTARAQMYKKGNIAGTRTLSIVAIMKEADVWPEGKLNSSLGITKLW